MSIPANTTIRVISAYQVAGVQCVSRIHFLTQAQSADAAFVGNCNSLFFQWVDQFRKLLSQGVVVTTGAVYALEIPSLPPVVIAGSAIGARLGAALPAEAYMRLNLIGGSRAGFSPTRNQFRFSGVSQIDVRGNHCISNLISTMSFIQIWLRDQTNLGGTFACVAGVWSAGTVLNPGPRKERALYTNFPTSISVLKSRQT